MSAPLRQILSKPLTNQEVLDLLAAMEKLPKAKTTFFRNTMFKNMRMLKKEAEEIKTYRKEILEAIQKAREDLALSFAERTDKGTPKKREIGPNQAQYVIPDDKDEEFNAASLDLNASFKNDFEGLSEYMDHPSEITSLFVVNLSQVPDLYDEHMCTSIDVIIIDDVEEEDPSAVEPSTEKAPEKKEKAKK